MYVTLGIDDEDAVDIVRDIERSFDIIISNSEAAACWTLGDIFDLVLQRFSDSGRGGHTCASAMAFYRLRRAFASIAPTVKLKPSTQLTDVAKMSVKRLFEEIETQTALKLPRKATSPVGWIGAVGIIGGLLATVPVGIIGGGSALLVLGAAVFIALWLLYVDPGKLPKDCKTLGELSTKVARLNFGHLAKAGARVTPEELWSSLIEVVSQYSPVPTAEMKPEAILLQSQRDAA